MRSMKLNAAEMASLYGGNDPEQTIIGVDVCATECGACYPGQDKAKEEYKKNMTTWDRNWGT